MKGYRNLWICMAYLVWALGETALIIWRLESPEVAGSLGGVAAIITGGAGGVGLVVFGRAAKAKAQAENGEPPE